MREIHVNEITSAIRDLAIRSNTELGEDVLKSFQEAFDREESPAGKDILQRLIQNASRRWDAAASPASPKVRWSCSKSAPAWAWSRS